MSDNIETVFFRESRLHNKRLIGAVELCDDGTYCSFVANLPGVTSCGDTIEEAKDNLLLAFDDALDLYKELNIEPPFEGNEHEV